MFTTVEFRSRTRIDYVGQMGCLGYRFVYRLMLIMRVTCMVCIIMIRRVFFELVLNGHPRLVTLLSPLKINDDSITQVFCKREKKTK